MPIDRHEEIKSPGFFVDITYERYRFRRSSKFFFEENQNIFYSKKTSK